MSRPQAAMRLAKQVVPSPCARGGWTQSRPGVLLKDGPIISPPTQIHSETSVLVTTGLGRLASLARLGMLLNIPAVHRQPQQQRIIWPQMLMLPRRRDGRQHWGRGHWSQLSSRSREKQELRSKMFPLTSDHGNTNAQISTEQHFSIWKFGRICKLIPSLGQACTERHPRLGFSGV